MQETKNTIRSLVVFIGLASFQPWAAQAQSVDPLIEGAKLCTRHLQRYETEYGIPAHLLSAIASTESGRYHNGLKIRLPWPWTINAEGKGYYFDSKEEAMAAAHKFYAQGIKSMDVGCMQVNLYHHAGAFSSISEAFEPQTNVAYAASFLRNLYQDEGSWKKAASDYHSKTPNLGKKYVGLVYDSWFKIVDKLRTARMSIPPSSVNGLREMQQADLTPTKPVILTSSAPVPKRINVAQAERNDISAFKTPHSKSIRVISSGPTPTGERKKENGIIVVHPEISVVSSNALIPAKNVPPEPMVMADASPVAPKQSVLDMAPSAGPPSAKPSAFVENIPSGQAKIIRIDNKLVSNRSTDTVKKQGPNFIFND